MHHQADTLASYLFHTYTELQFQSPPACPAYYVPRVELMNEISSAVLNSDTTPTIGTTVTIRGIGGIGKSTIAKALCHDPIIKEHFTDGFLWISLTPPLPSPVNMLSEIYQRLTGKSTTNNFSVLKNEIKVLVSYHTCKLLVILDDVWEAKDAMIFVDMFNNCKTILTTRKMNINGIIPPIACFDIKSMLINESLNLLTLQIVDIQTLHVTDVVKIKELAKDLHCWPLLLNLVHGQLYVHCIEWNESPQDAILKVQQKLFDNGLTAFDSEDQLTTSRENAVRASITASLELLTKTEENVLFCIASSIIGFGVYTIKELLSTVLDMDSTQFEKCTKSLWCHGLISFHDITFPNVIFKIPCIEVHEVIAQFINENMPDEFYLSFSVKTMEVYRIVFMEKFFKAFKVANVALYFLSRADTIIIPCSIRFMIFLTKIIQISFSKRLNTLVGENIQFMQVLDNKVKKIIYNYQFPPLKHMHKIIQEDCSTIHSLLVDGKYNEVVAWTKQYFDNHPCKLTLEMVISNLNILLDSCKNSFNHKAALTIENYISHYTETFDTYNLWRKSTIVYAIGFLHVIYLTNAEVSDDDVNHYLACSQMGM